MKNYAVLVTLLLLVGCASTGQEERINATKDFVAVNELEKVAKIRTYDRIDQHVLNDRYVILSTRREQYLLEYSSVCREDPLTSRVRPDVRRDTAAIYADSDTFRGCRIGALYPISGEQAEELKSIGKAPGE